MERDARYYLKQELSSPGFIRKLKVRWEKTQVINYLTIYERILSAELSALSKAELLKIFQNFSRVYDAMWREAIFLDSFDYMSEILFDEMVLQENINISDQEKVMLVVPVNLSWYGRQQQGLLKIIELIQKKKNDWQMDPTVISLFKKHAQKYHWMQNGYFVVKNLEVQYFMDEARELLANPKLLAQERAKIKSVLLVNKKKQTVFKNLKCSREFITKINFLVKLSEWRDDRKAYNQMGDAALRCFVEAFARRSAFTIDDWEQMWWWEIIEAFESPRKIKDRLKVRKQGIYSLGHPSRADSILPAKQGKEFLNFMKGLVSHKRELTGRVAFSGMVQGTVKVICSAAEFGKFQNGDILVAPNTRPDYLPIMKIAGAMVSEEGGLTCHTAIVARELKIPAIVGVQGAIAALKDGDRVEVDATRGVVKKI